MSDVQPLPPDQLLDRCIDEIIAGRCALGECLAGHGEQYLGLNPLIIIAAQLSALPRIPERKVDPWRRATLMERVPRTRQWRPFGDRAFHDHFRRAEP